MTRDVTCSRLYLDRKIWGGSVRWLPSYIYFSFCIIICSSFVCLYSLCNLLLMLLYSEAVVWYCSAKKVFLQILQNLQEKRFTEKRFRHRCFLVNSAKRSHNTFFNEPFGWLLLHKHSFCLLSRYGFPPFQKWCHTYFLAEYFFCLICKLGTRVNSIFQTLRQKPISNPVEHLRWSIFCENS